MSQTAVATYTTEVVWVYYTLFLKPLTNTPRRLPTHGTVLLVIPIRCLAYPCVATL
jgi:hypothetical protein